jgi:hypothetical protein
MGAGAGGPVEDLPIGREESADEECEADDGDSEQTGEFGVDQSGEDERDGEDSPNIGAAAGEPDAIHKECKKEGGGDVIFDQGSVGHEVGVKAVGGGGDECGDGSGQSPGPNADDKAKDGGE